MDPKKVVDEFNITISNRTTPMKNVLITIGNFNAETEEELTSKGVWKFGLETHSAVGQWQIYFCVEMEYVTQ